MARTSERPARRSQALEWTKTETPAGGRWPVFAGVVWSTPTQAGTGRIIVGKSSTTDMWHVGGWRPDHPPQLAQFPSNEFPSAEKAMDFVEDLAAAHARAHNRAPNYGIPFA